jgi:hypothetical protein
MKFVQNNPMKLFTTMNGFFEIYKKKKLAKAIVAYLDKELNSIFLNEQSRVHLVRYYQILKNSYNNKAYWQPDRLGFSLNEKAIYYISYFIDDLLRSHCIVNDDLLDTYVAVRLEFYCGVKMEEKI